MEMMEYVEQLAKYYDAWPEVQIGTSSVTYKSAVFKENDEFASAQGFFTHVYVNRTSQKASPISKEFREKLNKIFKP